MQIGKLSILNVVFVLFILFFVAQVFPLFVRREGTPRHPCINNLKQCAQALKMYSDDYDGKLPSSYLVNRSTHWNSPDFLTFTTTLGKYPPVGCRKRTIWQILYDNMKSKDIMFCPDDPAYEGINTIGTLKASTPTSYWYKVANDKAWYGIGCPASRRSMSDFGYESDQIAFYEHEPWHFGKEGCLRNGVLTNVSYMDTHVETIKISHATSGNRTNCAANSDGEPMYYNCATDPKTGSWKTQPGPGKLTDPTYCYDVL